MAGQNHLPNLSREMVVERAQSSHVVCMELDILSADPRMFESVKYRVHTNYCLCYLLWLKLFSSLLDTGLLIMTNP